MKEAVNERLGDLAEIFLKCRRWEKTHLYFGQQRGELGHCDSSKHCKTLSRKYLAKDRELNSKPLFIPTFPVPSSRSQLLS